MKKTKTLLLYAAFMLGIIVLGLIEKDKWYNIAFSVLAIVYLLLLTEGRRCAYLLCSIFAADYAVIALRAGFYATAAFHLLVLFPVSTYRFFVLSKKHEKAAVVKSLSLKGWAVSLFFCVLLSVGLYFLLRETGDTQPFLDGVILSLSLLTCAMMFGNYREMWWFNLAGSALYVVMWLVEFFSSGTGFSWAVMQAIVSVINIKGIVDWKKLKNK